MMLMPSNTHPHVATLMLSEKLEEMPGAGKTRSVMSSLQGWSRKQNSSSLLNNAGRNHSRSFPWSQDHLGFQIPSHGTLRLCMPRKHVGGWAQGGLGTGFWSLCVWSQLIIHGVACRCMLVMMLKFHEFMKPFSLAGWWPKPKMSIQTVHVAANSLPKS